MSILWAARDRLQTLLDKLKAHGLLMNGIDGDSVKMHDIIRDVGISIASADPNNMYNIRSNDELKMYLDNEKLKDAVAISLGANFEDQFLPPRLKCSKLRLLWMINFGAIGRADWKLELFTEELNMEGSFRNWKVEGVVNGSENNASLSEIKNLSKLTALFLNIPEANMLSQDLFSTELKRFKITLGTEGYCHEGSRILELIKFNISRLLKENGFKMLLKRSLRKLELSSCRTIEEVVTYSADQDHHDSIEFPKLKEMSLRGGISSLESLELGLNFERIWWEASCNYKLQNLRSLIVGRCHSLKYLFSFPIARSLSQLEHLEVRECRNMEEILVVNFDDQLAQVDLFPKLKHLELRYLHYERESGEGLQWSRSDIHDHQSNSDSATTTFFNPKVIGFPSLETLHLKDVNMEGYGRKITNLQLKHSLWQFLSQEFKSYSVDCRDMEEILFINYKELPASNTGLENYKLLLKLQVVSLEDLPNLTGFCSRSTGYNIVNCGLNTEQVKISKCPNLFAINETDKQENHDDQDINSISEHKLKVGFPDDELEMYRLNHQFPAACSNITTLNVEYLSN
ncbi:hypothetical protein FNV43_RR00730 [Rhamnella rubrinervis]|uniref:Disease resistance protein At4g27190-like leucine-rich repeats domain-containing protein n=1 Tax=Rhamnella rubrinervis TaxID=2594499 RepID=A0A8K0HNJ8_9ROSA|nr:hypothetical protein FNV43_RR00730 [Rhamnella rubrinervis]